MAGSSMTMNASSFFKGSLGMLKQMGNMQLLAESVGESLVSSTKQRFVDTEDPDGNEWQESERAKNEGGKTLTDKALLKNSIGYEATPTTVVVGSNSIYAAIHQFGGPTGKNKSVEMPARPSIGINEEDQAEAAEMIRLHMVAGWKR